MNEKNSLTPTTDPDNLSAPDTSVKGTVEPGRNIPTSTNYKKSLYWGLIFGVLLAILILFFAPAIREASFIISSLMQNKNQLRAVDFTHKNQELKKLQTAVERNQFRYQNLIPGKPYLIVNTSDNWIYLKSKNQIIHEGPCSTGSYVLLKSRDNRHWMFKTPRGMFQVQLKLVHPVWRMPDWAFIEEGREIPPPDSPERFDQGALGKYALGIGKGYLIHGTLYKRLLGMPVTHGCVRLDDPELNQVYKYLGYGSKVFIY
jgi:L,D-transpeptidase catalytic domain